jgi:hypothetical protein
LLEEFLKVVRETACEILSLRAAKLFEQWDNPANVRRANCKLGGGCGSDTCGRTRVSGVIVAFSKVGGHRFSLICGFSVIERLS